MNRTAAAFAASIMLCGHAVRAAEPPNIVLIVADDLGADQIERIETPNLDELAAQGRAFSDAYAGSSLCAPSRAALLLGDHTGHVEPRGNLDMRLSDREVTLAEALQRAGYVTGMFGKWGFGYRDDPTTWPERHGWDEYLAYLHHMDAHDHTPPFLWQNGKRRDLSGEYAQDLFDAASLDFVARHQDDRFFLYLPSALPHAPYTMPGVTGTDDEMFAAMVQRLDASIGALADELRDLGLADRTMVIVTSDNGPLDSNELRGEKGTLYEGGLRVPLAISWPGTIAGGTHDGRLAASWDIYATVADLAGLAPPDGGRSLLRPHDPDRALYWELHYITTAQAVRWGRWKALRQAPNEPVELYDLRSDPREQRDVAAQRPDLVRHALSVMRQKHVESPDWPMRESTIATDLEWFKRDLHEWLVETVGY